MVRPVPACGLALLLSCLAVRPAPGDEIEFTNGNTLEGEGLSETDGVLTLKVDGGQISVERRMVRSIRRSGGEGGGAAPSGTAPGGAPAEGPAAPAAAPAPFPGAVQEGGYWSLLWSPERRVGWRQVQVRRGARGTTFEEEAVFLGEDGRVEATTRLLEEAGPALEPISFLYRESTGGKELSRSGTVAAGRLSLETFLDGVRTTADHPLPAGFRLPLAARAFVLSEFDRLPGGWRGTTFDARSGEFTTLALRCTSTERIPWEGRPEEVCVLRRERAGVIEEERVTPDGRVLTADLNGPGLVAVATTAGRVEALRRGGAVPASDEEKRARTAFLSPEDGFRIFKPGAAWTFVGPAGRDAALRLTVKDVTGVVFLSVSAEPLAPGLEEAPPAALGAALERRMRATTGGFEKLEDGYGVLAGEEAYRILCDAKLKGDAVRTLAWTLRRGGKVWTLAASAPASTWTEALPYIERILEGFEWL